MPLDRQEPTRPVDLVDRLEAGERVRHLVTGTIGTGKTWFASELARHARARSIDVIEVGCVEFEADTAFLPLSLVLAQAGVRAGDDELLDAAFGNSTEAANVLTLGTAVADALHERSTERPLLLVIDDAHWADADSISALLFAARRLDDAAIGLVLTAAPGVSPRVERSGLDPIRLERWTTSQVVDHLVDHGFTPAAARAGAATTGGNPLAVSLLIRAVDGEQRAGLVPLPPAIPVPSDIASRFEDRFADLADTERLAIAVAAAMAGADRHLAEDVLARCEIPDAAWHAISTLDVVVLEPVIRWTEPIARSAALHMVDRSERLAIHRHVADVAHAAGRDDLALRHRAAAGIGVDDVLAGRLEEAGHAAVQRGAPLTAAEAFRQSALASSRPADRSRRLGYAANEAFVAGNSELAVPYARAAIEIGDGETWATATSLLGEAQMWTEGWAAADRTLCDGARRVGDSLPAHAAGMLIHATIQTVVGLDARAARERASLAQEAAVRSGNEILQLPIPIMGAIADALAGSSERSDPVLAGSRDLAMAALGFQHPIGAAIAELVGFAAITREDHEAGIELLRATNDMSRRTGSIGGSALTSFLLADALWRTGRWAHAQVEATQAVDLVRDAGFEFLAECGEGFRAWVIAATGRRDECVALAGRALQRTEPLELRFLSAWAHAAVGLAALSDGDADAATDAFDRVEAMWARGDIHEPNLLWWQADHVEAAVQAGRTTVAESAFDRLCDDAERTGRPHALAMVAKCRGLLSTDPAQTIMYLDDAVDRLRAAPAPFDLARCLLLRGQTHLDRGDAAVGLADLANARTEFDRLGAHPWSDRASAARSEAASAPSGLSDLLTDAELRVALTVASGAQNREAAEQLFVSAKTVEYHLSNIYRKLGLRSRVDLVRFVADHS